MRAACGDRCACVYVFMRARTLVSAGATTPLYLFTSRLRYHHSDPGEESVLVENFLDIRQIPTQPLVPGGADPPHMLWQILEVPEPREILTSPLPRHSFRLPCPSAPVALACCLAPHSLVLACARMCSYVLVCARLRSFGRTETNSLDVHQTIHKVNENDILMNDGFKPLRPLPARHAISDPK